MAARIRVLCVSQGTQPVILPPVILPPCHPGLRAGISDHRRPFNIIEAPDLEIPALRFAPAGMTRMGALRPG